MRDAMGRQPLILDGQGSRNGAGKRAHGSGQVVLLMSWNEIADLVQRAQAGNMAAYGTLVERFQPTVYAIALARLRNPAEAQELTQEVFLHGMRKLSQL